MLSAEMGYNYVVLYGFTINLARNCARVSSNLLSYFRELIKVDSFMTCLLKAHDEARQCMIMGLSSGLS